MKTKEYVVTCPAGVWWAGQLVPAGETILAADGGAMTAYLHFKQVSLVPPAPTGPAADL